MYHGSKIKQNYEPKKMLSSCARSGWISLWELTSRKARVCKEKGDFTVVSSVLSWKYQLHLWLYHKKLLYVITQLMWPNFSHVPVPFLIFRTLTWDVRIRFAKLLSVYQSKLRNCEKQCKHMKFCCLGAGGDYEK